MVGHSRPSYQLSSTYAGSVLKVCQNFINRLRVKVHIYADFCGFYALPTSISELAINFELQFANSFDLWKLEFTFQ